MSRIEIDPVQLLIDKIRHDQTGEKDRLDKEAAAATAQGLSYGKYKALQKEGLLPAQEEDAKPEPAEYIPGPVHRRQVRVNYPPPALRALRRNVQAPRHQQ